MGPERRPRSSVSFRGAHRRQVSVSPGPPYRLSYPEVSRGKYVGAMQGEDQVHLRGPRADSANGGQFLHDLVVGPPGEPAKIQTARGHVGPEVL